MDGRKRGTQGQAIGQSKGGWTTKILALVDALGNLVRFVLMPANRYDTVGVAPLIKGVEFDAILAPSRDIFYENTLPGSGQGVRQQLDH